MNIGDKTWLTKVSQQFPIHMNVHINQQTLNLLELCSCNEIYRRLDQENMSGCTGDMLQ